MRTALPLLALSSALAVACNPAPATLGEADLAAIRSVSDEFTKSFTSGDRAALLELYTDDATLMPPGAPAVKGRPAIGDFLSSLPKITDMQFTLEEIDGRGDLAFVRGKYRMTLEIPGAPGPVEDTGKFVEILRKQADGKWLVAVDIFNSDMPTAPPPPPAEPTSGS